MFDYIFCQFKHIIDSKWNWDTAWYFITAIGTWVAAIGTVGTLIFLACPTIKKYYIKQKLDKRLNTFFKEYSKNKEPGKDQKSLFIMNFDAVQDTIFNPEKSDKIQKLNFFKNQNIVALEKDIKINNVKIKSGFHFYEIISDNCIRVDFFIKNYELRSAFIHKKNNVPEATIMGDDPEQIPKNQITINKNTEFTKIEGNNKYLNNEFVFKSIIKWKKEI